MPLRGCTDTIADIGGLASIIGVRWISEIRTAAPFSGHFRDFAAARNLSGLPKQMDIVVHGRHGQNVPTVLVKAYSTASGSRLDGL